MSSESVSMSPAGESPPPKRPRVWTVYVAFFVALLLTSVATVALIGLSFSLAHPGVTPSRQQLMEHALLPATFSLTVLVSGVILSATSLIAAVLSSEPLVERLQLKGGVLRPLPISVAAAGIVALSVVIENLTLLFGVEIGGTLEMIGRSIGRAEGVQSVIIVALISLGPGIGEELLFRGYIQTRLVKRHGPLVAVVITSLLFGIMHMDALQSTLTAFLGVYLGFLAYRFGSLWPAVCAHAVNNGVSALALTFFPEEPVSPDPSMTALLLGLAVFSASLAFVLRTVPPRATSARTPSSARP